MPSEPGTGRGPASELMRSLGLLVDGPLRWGAPLLSRSPGVFLVELPGGSEEAPLDNSALRRWLERVPELRLDGRRPTVQQLGERLASFWLSGEPVLYVGRSAKGLAGRVAALHATVLGDARPHAGGHWLKTLVDPGRLRFWWAETEAHEEYEDALLEAIAVRQPSSISSRLHDPGVVLPFANLQDSTGRSKSHGLQDFLRSAAASAPGTAATVPSGRQTRSPRPRSPARLSRSPARRPTAAQPPPVEPTYLSAQGLERLQNELDDLRDGVRPGVIARVKAARELGDLRENAEYESARKEQSFVEGRIQALEAMIKAAVVIEAGLAGDTVVIGSTVTVESSGEELVFSIVGSTEADPAGGRISYASPVGQALLGRRAGETVTVKLPRGEVSYHLREVG